MILVRCLWLRRYLVRVTVNRRISDIVHEKDLWVYSYRMPPEINDAIKMEVGIEDCLHIEFEYTKAKYAIAVQSCGSDQARVDTA